MTLTVLVEQLESGKFRATTAHPVALTSEGISRDEAITRLQQLASERLSGGEVLEVEVPDAATPNPWLRAAGIWKDRTDLDAFQANIDQYRREVDAAGQSS